MIKKTLLQSGRPKLYTILAFLSDIILAFLSALELRDIWVRNYRAVMMILLLKRHAMHPKDLLQLTAQVLKQQVM